MPETLALDVVHEVGLGGDYVGTAHTLRHFREVWYPRVFDRRAHPAWVEAGRAIARQALAAHTPSPLPPATLDTLRGIVAQADARAGLLLQGMWSDHRIGATNRG